MLKVAGAAIWAFCECFDVGKLNVNNGFPVIARLGGAWIGGERIHETVTLEMSKSSPVIDEV